MIERDLFPTWSSLMWPSIFWWGGWLAVTTAALALRPPLPVDETRYLAVAWEMWRDGNFLVPHLNGEAYSHKPPLLFWLMNLGWAVFGVNEWTPRLVAPLFGLGTLALTAALAGRLWPEDARAARLAPLFLFGSAFFALFTTLTMFDLILAFFAVLALIGLAVAAEGRMVRGMMTCGVALGLGVLAKGPAILIHVLPAALAAPLWAPGLVRAQIPSWARWYGGILGAVALGAAIALAWAIPAAIVGGPEFAHAIFVGQSAGRMVESFAHERPIWWFAAWLPILLLPWTVWPALWKAVGNKGLVTPLGVHSHVTPLGVHAHDARIGADAGSRLCLIWFGFAFVAFSLISGKQLHYLLPEFPALALITARVLAGAEIDPRGGAGRPGAEAPKPNDPAALLAPGLSYWRPAPPGAAVPALVLFAVALLAGLMPVLPGTARIVAKLEGVAPAWMALPALAALGVAFLAWRGRLTAPEHAARALMAVMAVLVVAVHLAARPLLVQAHDLAPTAKRLKAWEDAGEAIAHVAKYHGQFHFAGRLNRPIAVIGLTGHDVEAWLAAHKRGKVISYRDRLPPPSEPQPLSADPFRDGWVVVWDRDQLARFPRSVYRD